MYKYFLTIFFLLLIANSYSLQNDLNQIDPAMQQEIPYQQDNGDAQTDSSETADILSDTSLHVFPVTISADSIQKWKSSKEFAYIGNLDSLLKLKQKQDISNLSKANEDVSGSFLQRLLSSAFIQVLLWGIAAIFVGVILYRLFSLDAVFRRQPAVALTVETAGHDVKVSAAEYDKLVTQACRLGDYRMAVRYLFLKCLAGLEKDQYLVLSADKTNFQYVQEIDSRLKNDFSSLVLIYDYIWYGGIAPDKEMYTGIEKKFTEFNKKMTR